MRAREREEVVGAKERLVAEVLGRADDPPPSVPVEAFLALDPHAEIHETPLPHAARSGDATSVIDRRCGGRADLAGTPLFPQMEGSGAFVQRSGTPPSKGENR